MLPRTEMDFQKKDRVAREVLQGGRVKGGMLRAHLTWVREFKTAAEQEALWKKLPADVAKELSGVVLATSWYPFEWLIKLDRAIDELYGGGRGDLFVELGRFSAKLNLSTTYRVFDRESNHDFFANSAPLHTQFQDFGSVLYEKTGETSGRMVHRDYRCVSPVFCASAIGYYEQSILLHAAKNAVVREVECQTLGDKTCTFEMSWT